ncbi:MAG: VOC family protein [Pararhodobacter sp.]|nr:VOC family protein [Pararhodobacter sp.]
MIDRLDHCGLAVADLEPARALFASLGFTLTPRETLTRPGEDGTHVNSGADNHVFMLNKGYVELIAVTDPDSGHMLVPRLARYMGLHIVVLGSDDVDAVHARLAAAGVGVTPCMTWGRSVAGGGEARFRFFLYTDDSADESVLCVVQHLTPDALRPGNLLSHANGATALNGVTLHVTDLQAGLARYARLLGQQPDDRATFRFSDGTWLRLADTDALKAAFPGAMPPAAPSVAAVEIALDDMEAPARAGLSPQHDAGGVWIGPGDAFGAIIRFVPVS